jgi:nitrous oxide reductase accessory protein NosL
MWMAGMVLAMTLLAVPVLAQMYQTVEQDQAQLLQDGPGRLYCPSCGMHLVKFYRTGHALKQPDGHIDQYCSLHCLVEANPNSLSGAQVVDQASLQFIPAAEATYVVGSAKPGTMTMKSKYAFADPAQAQAFAAEHGGQVVDFAAAQEIARGGLAMENEKIGAKRAQMAQKGEKVFQTFLSDVELPAFSTIAEAKTYVAQTSAGSQLKDDQLQAVALYLMSRGEKAAQAGVAITVPAKAKCPVCGMFVAKYPKWAASLTRGDSEVFYFDGVKDLMKFVFDPQAYHVGGTIEASDTIHVTDFYTLGAIDARQAFYVVGSNIYGPMGNELIPFATRDQAEVFLKDHSGDQVVTYTQITPELVRQLDQ